MRKNDDGLGRDPHRGKPRTASRSAVAVRLNRLAEVTNFLSEQLSELRRDLRVAERIEDPRPSFSVRYVEPE